MRLTPTERLALLAHPGVSVALTECRDGDVIVATGPDDEMLVHFGPRGREALIAEGFAPSDLEVDWPAVLLVRRRPDPLDPEFEQVFALRVKRAVKN